MRSFEFVEGSSAKFWEIDLDGSEVTVRWGRSGTTGQTKVKTLDDPASAAAHETKLIAEKLRKGYAETTATTAPASVSPPAPAPAVARDEDTFVFPEAWHRHRFARRGSSGVGRFTPDPKARKVVDEELTRTPGQVTKVLQAPTTDMAVSLQAVAWLEGHADATPLGAAAVAAATGLGAWQHRDRLIAFADVWIAEHGLRFAAEAAVELMSLIVQDDALPPGPRYHHGKEQYGVRHMRTGETRHSYYSDAPVMIALRVRHALASAPEAEYEQVVAALTPYRGANAYARAGTSLVLPEQLAWVDEDVAAAVADADDYRGSVLLTAASTAAQVDALVQVSRDSMIFSTLAMLTTLLDGAGTDAAGALFHWLGNEWADADAQRRLLAALAALPGDDIMRGLVDRVDSKYVAPALLDAAERYPARALRLLAEGASKRSVADLLRAQVLAHPEIVEPVLAELTPAAAARIEAIVGDAAALVVAPLSAVPPLLADPPWQHRGKATKPVVIAGLACTDPATISWSAGERDAWADTPFHRHSYQRSTETWKRRAERVITNQTAWNEPPTFFVEAPEEIARPVLATWRSRETWQAGGWMRPVVARFELEALPNALDLARRTPADVAPVVAPYASPEIAVLMADWLGRLKTVRPVALAWLLRHPVEAARALVPVALGKPGLPRRQAENALLALRQHEHGDTVRGAAQTYGPEAAAAIDTLLAADPLAALPAKLPAVPAWAVPGLLPPLKLRDGSGVLPAEAVANVIMVLAMSRIDEPYAGLEIVKQACDPESFAEFGWGLFSRWQTSGAAAKENWVLDSLGLLGDDETVRRLSPLILTWPGEGGHAKAVTGLNVLAAIGSDVALMHLHGIAQRAKFKGLKTAAGQKMDEVAAALGLSAEQLADRLVPDLGLEPDGSMVLDYGARQFTVGFDEQLRPYVADSTGKRLKALPKPGARDDGELAPAAYKTFSALKKDVRTIAADQIRRLERAMVSGRRWTGAEFHQLFVEHPLVWHIVRRLVWGLYDESGTLTGAVRVAEDRTFSTVQDDETTLPDDAIVGVAHPLQLADGLPDWVEVFADYEILQPFPQLSRQTFALTPEEAATSRLTRFEGITVPTGRVIGLERRGWRRETPQDAGIQGRIELTVDAKREVVIELDPGIAIGAMDIFPEQKLDMVFLWDITNGSRWGNRGDGHLPLGSLDAVTISEVIRDLTEITA
ncbi:hypothetical protein GCM10010435_46520 [Winogradskya consettensis]|uniref:WGR domain-containing protein n=1 Tax=Winogradskya consettensis TaxID=113560 RepID=A0A919T296_9ACTN|nr:DUF4132 domain-containing protein [Actinoplanes consettensis]GIM83092.1 hypothetical protein Aco04nite_84900 [Actinoplanes consettensis]